LQLISISLGGCEKDFMKLINFDLESAYDAIELEGLGLTWDLHNVLEFRGFEFRRNSGELRLSWEGSPNSVDAGGAVVDNPFGYGGCVIAFRGVEHVRLAVPSVRDSPESATLHAVSKVRPGEGEYRFRLDRTSGEPFHLIFEFVSGLQLEVGAQEAELIGIARAAA
jgi:hypothetical protein